MIVRVSHNGQFDAIAVSSKLAYMVKTELDLRDNQKPGSILPEMLETVRQFIVANAEAFDEFQSRRPFVDSDPRLEYDLD